VFSVVLVSDSNSIPTPRLCVAVPVVLFIRFRFLTDAFAVAVLDETVRILPANVRFADAVAALVEPSLIMRRLPLALFIVLNPEPEVPDEPEEPDVPDEPEEPDVPDEPEEPDVPEEPVPPDVPDVPLEPVPPDVPLEPEEPEVPDEPEEPDEPDVPDEPEEPEVPDEPEEPDEPDVPLEPEEPEVPDEPEEPDEPDVPLEPLEPEVPDVPDEPVPPDVPLVPEVPDVPDVAAVYETPFSISSVAFNFPVSKLFAIYNPSINELPEEIALLEIEPLFRFILKLLVKEISRYILIGTYHSTSSPVPDVTELIP
jgi:hypothetical protein